MGLWVGNQRMMLSSPEHSPLHPLTQRSSGGPEQGRSSRLRYGFVFLLGNTSETWYTQDFSSQLSPLFSILYKREMKAQFIKLIYPQPVLKASEMDPHPGLSVPLSLSFSLPLPQSATPLERILVRRGVHSPGTAPNCPKPGFVCPLPHWLISY